jgi:protein-L-isoaspartate(D-aspartate) O-methyltransferase
MKHIPLLLLFILFTLKAFPEGAEETYEYQTQREDMVYTQIVPRGISDELVIEAMLKVPRHLFVPSDTRGNAYGDYPLHIGEGQTISQPYIVALMTEHLSLTGDERVLEIGTGSGYQAAILAYIVDEVFTIEIKEVLYQRATQTLTEIGFTNIKTKHGDGYFGWEEYQPFDCIMITAAVDHIPPPLITQLKDGGRMILPLGDPYSILGQMLVLVTKEGEDYRVEHIIPVMFVPMTGEALNR